MKCAAVIAIAMFGCGDPSPKQRMSDLADKVCACTNFKCVRQLTDELVESYAIIREQANELTKAQRNELEVERLRYETCAKAHRKPKT